MAGTEIARADGRCQAGGVYEGSAAEYQALVCSKQKAIAAGEPLFAKEIYTKCTIRVPDCLKENKFASLPAATNCLSQVPNSPECTSRYEMVEYPEGINLAKVNLSHSKYILPALNALELKIRQPYKVVLRGGGIFAEPLLGCAINQDIERSKGDDGGECLSALRRIYPNNFFMRFFSPDESKVRVVPIDLSSAATLMFDNKMSADDVAKTIVPLSSGHYASVWHYILGIRYYTVERREDNGIDGSSVGFYD